MLQLLLFACTTSAPVAPPSSAPVPVKIQTLAPASLDHTLSAVGQLQTLDSVELRAEGSGLVEQVYFEDGQTVQRGKVLLTLRSAEADAGLVDARARAKLAFLDLERTTALFQRGDMAQADLDRAQANNALAVAAVAKAEEGVRKTRIVAPFDGKLGRREVSVGQLVDPSRVLGRLERMDPLLVEASFGEEASGQILPDQHVDVTIEGFPPVSGTVRYTAPRLDTSTRTQAVRVGIANPDGRLLPGMTATISVITQHREDALLAPTEALTQSASGPALWIVGADQKVTLKPVKIGERQAAKVEILEGVAAGDQVVVEGLARLRPGAAVVVTP